MGETGAQEPRREIGKAQVVTSGAPERARSLGIAAEVVKCRDRVQTRRGCNACWKCARDQEPKTWAQCTECKTLEEREAVRELNHWRGGTDGGS